MYDGRSFSSKEIKLNIYKNKCAAGFACGALREKYSLILV
ncbi:hypothetical protein BD94_3626 [Elizabethkingia anophelis NUHP1]|uniref:Uncharacterized protein n=1 Tax=Elizabethkingia anophelis NUHP1 TaxID=1338011 RepID=A0A077EID5_9FLAO|nr:hypothetical protein BD94_3626 [Elizabethkingia anophelis NUHP1]